ncbi:carbonic anhydrase [Parvularcula sp. LCG005]|uniref:carbonic anhydrase n=1 Tax=Parvularcula sp. LCG005 TaxID=3078805 RepID=UPI002942561E|nr:carbonic anhydrase [Parvularcula sp. LCG005]WOI52249.1 carbonic anhydrase [Parvularcula sp. LCG005]
MPRFASGVVNFQSQIFPEKREFFEKLAEGQKPECLFITCSDSRIETAMLTQTDPGELFIARNAGNIVPPHTEHTGGMTASIEFAVAILRIPHIVICGHTECGAMSGLMQPESVEGYTHVRKWLGYSKAAVEIVNEVGQDLSDEDRMLLLTQQNVVLQLRHLKTHPSVAARLAKGDLTLHGWVYDIRSGRVEAYDSNTKAFVPVQDRYAEDVAALNAQHCGHDHS